MNAWLVIHGRIRWPQAARLLDGSTCAWADLDGFHAQPPPDTAPIATHLWAWHPRQLIRLRIDGTDCIGATLHLDNVDGAEPITVTIWTAPTWPNRESRVSADPQWRDRTTTNYDVTGLTPLTFTRLDGKTDHDQYRLTTDTHTRLTHNGT